MGGGREFLSVLRLMLGAGNNSFAVPLEGCSLHYLVDILCIFSHRYSFHFSFGDAVP